MVNWVCSSGCEKKLLPFPFEFKSHFVACLLLVSLCALNNLDCTLDTILEMKGSTRKVSPEIYYLEKKYACMCVCARHFYKKDF